MHFEQQLMRISTTSRRLVNKKGGTCKYYYTCDVSYTSLASQLIKNYPNSSTVLRH